MTRWQPVDIPVEYSYPAISQAVVVEPSVRQLWISGQVGWDENGELVSDDAVDQAVAAFENIGRILRAAGGKWEDVVVMRIFTTSEEAWKAVREVREQFLGQPRPASTMVVVSRLVDPRMHLEIEAMAALPSQEPA